jgi:hypothetical protein
MPIDVFKEENLRRPAVVVFTKDCIAFVHKISDDFEIFTIRPNDKTAGPHGNLIKLIYPLQQLLPNNGWQFDSLLGSASTAFAV